jgi:hypothetical protein
LCGVEPERQHAEPPNTPLELTPLCGEQDRCDFETKNLLQRFPDLVVRRG